MEAIKYFLCLLGVDPFLAVIILILVGVSGLYPYRLKGKSVTKKKKDGTEETEYYEYKNF